MTLRAHKFIKLKVDMGMAVVHYDDALDEIVKIWNVPASSQHQEELWLQLVPKEPK